MSRRLTSPQKDMMEKAGRTGKWVNAWGFTRIARNLASLGLLEEDDSGRRGPNHFRITEQGRIQLRIEKTKIENAS